jgi:hypothetical protein
MRQKGWKKMRPELTVLNARLAKARREAAKAKADREMSFRQGYAIADGQGRTSPATILRGEVRVDEYVVATIPFNDRYRYATEHLAIGFEEEIKKYMTVDHINTHDGEIWRGELAIGKIIREAFSMNKLMRPW